MKSSKEQTVVQLSGRELIRNVNLSEEQIHLLVKRELEQIGEANKKVIADSADGVMQHAKEEIEWRGRFNESMARHFIQATAMDNGTYMVEIKDGRVMCLFKITPKESKSKLTLFARFINFFKKDSK